MSQQNCNFGYKKEVGKKILDLDCVDWRACEPSCTSNNPCMAESILTMPVTLTKKLGKIQNISVSVLIPASFSKILQDMDQLKVEVEGNSTWLREAMGLWPAI